MSWDKNSIQFVIFLYSDVNHCVHMTKYVVSSVKSLLEESKGLFKK